MSNHAPKVDLVSKLAFLISAIALLLAVYVLVSSLVNTFIKNSTKGEIDTTVKVAAVAENLKPIGIASTSDAPIAGAAGRSGKEIFDAVCTSCHSMGILGAPKFGDKAAWEARAANGLDGLIASATSGKGSMPAKGGDPSLTDSELRAVILYMTKESGLDLAGGEPAKAPVTKEEPKAKPVKEDAAPKAEVEVSREAPKVEAVMEEEPKTETTKVAEKVVEKTVETAPVAAAAATSTSSIDGKKVYDTVCFACHATGVANSPIFGNKEAWAPRIATGIDTLYTTALKGKGAMPPKGGNLNLDDDKVKAAVDYMVSKVQ